MSKELMILPDYQLARATCSVLVDGHIAGTAWLVSREGHLITAGHVLGTDEPLSQVAIKFANDIPHQAHLIEWGFQEKMALDFAILKLETPPTDREPLPISLTQSVNGECTVLGYGERLGGLSQGVGVFVGSYYENYSLTNRLFCVRSSELGDKGYSGGAVFSKELQAVVAIQISAARANIGPGRDTVLAMPLYRIAHHAPLLTDLWNKQDANLPRLRGPMISKPSLNLMVTGGQEVSAKLRYTADMIGREIVSRGHTLMSNGSSGVDMASANGAYMSCIAQNLDPNKKIRVFRPIKAPVPKFNFGYLEIVGQNYSKRRDVVLQKSDAIILLGGGKGTRSVAMQAKSLGKPIIPVGIGAVGKTAVDLWIQMQKESKSRILEDIGPHQTDLDAVAKSTVLIAERYARN